MVLILAAVIAVVVLMVSNWAQDPCQKPSRRLPFRQQRHRRHNRCDADAPPRCAIQKESRREAGLQGGGVSVTLACVVAKRRPATRLAADLCVIDGESLLPNLSD